MRRRKQDGYMYKLSLMLQKVNHNRVNSMAKSEFVCFFCRGRADRVGFYSKFYPESNKECRETPTLFCSPCWDKHRHTIEQSRGGMEGVFCITFEHMGRMTPRELAWVTGRKNYEVNELSSKVWKRLIWRIHYTHSRGKNAGRSVEVQGIGLVSDPGL